jgi:copper chaperone
METRVIHVTGMSCDHCAQAVRAEVGKLAGVTNVAVDVAAGNVQITADPFPAEADLHAAVDEAGYAVAGL